MDAGRHIGAPQDNQTDTGVATGRPARAGHVTFGEAAERLLDNGYAPLPIVPGAKRPAPTRWSTVTLDRACIRDWVDSFPEHGIGLRTGHLVGLDIDELDADRAHEVQRLAELRFGKTLVRVGQWPKRLLVYRTDAPFPKMKVGKVEILGAGQQFVAFGLHAATGRPYYWVDETPLDICLEDVPTIDHEAAAAYLAEIGPGEVSTGRRAMGGQRQAPSTADMPVRDQAGLVTDGRDGWLSRIAFHTVHDAIETGSDLDLQILSEMVWARFTETTDLSRPKQDGGRAYELSDAARKVHDKLRLHSTGALPARDRPESAPDYTVPTLNVAQARSQLGGEIESFTEDAYAWHAEGRQGEPPNLALRATVGLGKSLISRQHLSGLQTRLKDQGLPHRIMVFVASHALAEEAATAWEETGANVAVVRGYERKEPGTGRPICRNLKTVKAAIANRRDIQTSACQKNLYNRCRYFFGCAKQENRRQVSVADVVIAPYDAMFQKLAGAMAGIGVVVVDEACWQRAPSVLPGLSLGSFQAELVSPGRAFGSRNSGASRAADLLALRKKLHDALTYSGPGPLKRAACVTEGLDAAACRSAVELEEKRFRSRGATAGQDEDRIEEIVADAIWNERVYTLVDLWSVLETFLAGDTDSCPNLRIGEPDPKTRDSVIHCSQLRQAVPEFAHQPLLHLDATFRSVLATPILGEMREVLIDAAAPDMAVTLVPGSFGKTKLREGLQSSPGGETQARAGSLLARCVNYVSLVAWAHGRDEVLVVTNKEIEPVFGGLPNVSTAHFNAVAGIDAWKDVRALIVIGRPLPRDSDVSTLAGVHLGADAEGQYHATAAGVWMRDGGSRNLRVLRHEDPAAEVMRAAICDDELIQVIGRGRGVNRKADRPLDVHILADVALPLVHDRIHAWDSIKPGIFEQMLLAGAAVDSASDAFALYPEMFSSIEQAQKTFQRAPFKGQIPYIYIRGLSIKSAAYRRAGRGRSWQVAYWLDAPAADLRARLEAVSGPLAEWNPRQEPSGER